MNLETLAASYALGEILVDDLPRLATDALVAGAESVSLAALAGAERVTAPAELRELFVAALSELGIPLPTPLQAASLLKRHYARQVVSGEIAPREGAARIVRLYYAVEGLLPDRVYAADGFDIAVLYGSYHSYGDAFAQEPAVAAELDASVVDECRRIASQRSEG